MIYILCGMETRDVGLLFCNSLITGSLWLNNEMSGGDTVALSMLENSAGCTIIII